MKLIGTLQGITAIRYLPEEILPTKGVQQQALASTLRNTYGATPVPTVMTKPIQHTNIPPMTFANGRLKDGDTNYAISQMVIAANGLMIVSQSTDDSDKIFAHLTSLLDKIFGFKFESLETKTLYVSTVVVQLSRPIEGATEPLNRILTLIRSATRRSDQLALKRLVFGSEDDGGPIVTLDTIAKSDFVIERRAGAPFSENRYFSSAPLTTEKHIEVLQQIEDAVAAWA